MVSRCSLETLVIPDQKQQSAASSCSEVTAALVCATRQPECALPEAHRAGLFEVTVAKCILNLFSGTRAAGTWPMHCVCSSYLVGFVMCGGVAKGSGNVDFFSPA